MIPEQNIFVIISKTGGKLGCRGCEREPNLEEVMAELLERFDEADADNDGCLTLEEAQTVMPGLTQEQFALMDLNNDELLTNEELFSASGQQIEGESVEGEGEQPEELIAPVENFMIYDATVYSNKPDNLVEKGFHPIACIYEPEILLSPDDLDEEFVRQAARNEVEQTTNNMVVIDIECWPFSTDDSSAIVTETVNKLSLVADWFKDEMPELKVGFYSIPPIRDYWNAIEGQGANYKKWQDINDIVAPLADHIDVTFPSLYTFYEPEEHDGWTVYATANIAETRRTAPGKPTYPFIWHQYHTSSRLGTEIPEDFWYLQLQTIWERGADGVVIWGGWDFVNNGLLEWNNDSMSWWNATQKFIDFLEQYRGAQER